MNKYEIPDLLNALDDLDLVNVIGLLYDLKVDSCVKTTSDNGEKTEIKDGDIDE